MPFCSLLLEGEDAHSQAFALASTRNTPELTPVSYCFLLYRELHICIKMGWLQSTNSTAHSCRLS